MEIRSAIKADLGQLDDLGPRVCANAVQGFAVPFHYESWAEQMRSFLSLSDRRIIVALDGGRIAGLHAIIACPLPFNRKAIVVRTVTLWVHHADRGKGIAGDMHAAAAAWAREIGARAMFAGVPYDYEAHAELGDVDATPAAADGFYRSMGYTPVETGLVMEVR